MSRNDHLVFQRLVYQLFDIGAAVAENLLLQSDEVGNRFRRRGAARQHNGVVPPLRHNLADIAFEVLALKCWLLPHL